jgi:hypothetical protein
MARKKRDVIINIHLPEGSVVNVVGGSPGVSEGEQAIMAKVDEVQAAFDQLNAAVMEFINNGPGIVAEMQATIDQLRADDAVEDTKLDGLMNGITNLNGAIDALRGARDEADPNGPHPDQTLPGDLPPDEPHVEHRGS